MTDRPDPVAHHNISEEIQRIQDRPGFVDGIPVEELVRLTREFTGRITNEDRQRLAADLNDSGHFRAIQSGAPYLLQGFFSGRFDLDTELTRRYPTPPLVSNSTFAPKPGIFRKHGFAQFASQDTAATVTIEVHNPDGSMEVTFLLHNMLGIHFSIGTVAPVNRARFLDLIARPDGIAFLWTEDRWDRDYLIFVIRNRFARVYAFGPGRVEAACRLTPNNVEMFRQWLSGLWQKPTDSKTSAEDLVFNW